MTSSLPPGGGAHSRALKAEKSKSPPFPVGGGPVVTNDWCVIFKTGDTFSIGSMQTLEVSHFERSTVWHKSSISEFLASYLIPL